MRRKRLSVGDYDRLDDERHFKDGVTVYDDPNNFNAGTVRVPLESALLPLRGVRGGSGEAASGTQVQGGTVPDASDA